MPQSKFFKPYRGFAVSLAGIKGPVITSTYAWRTKRYSNSRSGRGKLPFEMSAEIRTNSGKSAIREKLPHQLRVCDSAPAVGFLRFRGVKGCLLESAALNQFAILASIDFVHAARLA
jgi:hypothetical protein